MKQHCFLVVLIIFALSNKGYAQTWIPVGSPEFSAGPTQYASIAIAGSVTKAERTDRPAAPTIYVAYEDFAYGARASVMKFNGSSRVYAGSPGFSADTVGFTRIAVNKQGTPYIVYEDAAYKGGAATVMKLDSTGWVNVGNPGFSAGQINWADIALDSNGTPYVVYSDFSMSGAIVVMKYNGSNWVNVGTPGFSAGEAMYESITIAPNGTPYVCMGDGWYGTKARVMKFNGTSWVNVGSPAFSVDDVGWTSIAIDTGGTPYVAYADAGFGLNAVVKKFDGSSWVYVGAPGFSESDFVQYTSMALDPGGVPYVVYEDANFYASAKKFNGTEWVNAGNPEFSLDIIGGTAIAFAGATPYVVYVDNKVTVMVLDTGNKSSVNHTDLPSTSLNIFPNPDFGTFTLRLSSSMSGTTIFTITNMMGERVADFTANTNEDLNVQTELPAGLYLVTALSAKGREIAKLVVK